MLHVRIVEKVSARVTVTAAITVAPKDREITNIQTRNGFVFCETVGGHLKRLEEAEIDRLPCRGIRRHGPAEPRVAHSLGERTADGREAARDEKNN